jgi:uncharacterized protein involved in exopolysaccharide biosynthesis
VWFFAPILFAAAIAVWFVLGSANEYKSTTSLWVDTPPPGASSLDQTNMAGSLLPRRRSNSSVSC